MRASNSPFTGKNPLNAASALSMQRNPLIDMHNFEKESIPELILPDI